MKKTMGLVALLCLSLGPTATAQDLASLSGLATDADSNEPLFGASVVLSTLQGAVVQGTATNSAGRFLIENLQPGDYLVAVSFVGYVGFELPVTLAAGESRTLNPVLDPDNININNIVVTASRREEKVLDSPASTTVISADYVAQDVAYSTAYTLRNTLGVDVAQVGLDQTELSLRGFTGLNPTFALHDYRKPSGPTGIILHSVIPSITIDMDRVEVVRGPASALYGAGGDEGVVHFISKNPFDHPGTTLSVTGGERSTLSAQYRHAGVVNNRLGYKVTALYTQADDWQLDPADSLDAALLARDVLTREYDFSKYSVNGMLEYRFDDDVSLIASTGYSELNGNIHNPLSTFQGDGVGTAYAQLRFRAGGFFAQAYGNWDNTGETLLYSTGLPLIQNGGRYAAQVQFDVAGPNDRSRFVVGADVDHAILDTDGTITGRHEDEDDVTLIGGYAQTTLQMAPWLNFTLALRGDWSNVYDDFQISPRAVLVIKPNADQTFRASFNQAFSAPNPSVLFLDIVGQSTQLDPTRQLVFYARGELDGFTFEQFRQTNQARFFLPVDGFFGRDFDIDALPLAPIYGAAAGGGLIDLLRSDTPLPQGGLTTDQRALLADLLGYTALNGSIGAATTGGTLLALPDESGNGYTPVEAPLDQGAVQQSTTQTFEVGYRGLLGGNSLLTLDVYRSNKKNFVGPINIITPLVYLQQAGVTGDIAAGLGALFQNTTDPAIQGLLAGLSASGLEAADVAGLLGALVGGALHDEAVAVVQTDETVLPPGTENTVGGVTGFKNFGNIDYWGLDASLEVLPSDALSLYGNISLVSDDLFDFEELGEEDVTLEVALNAPRFKAKLGGDYRFPFGLSLNVAGRYKEGFPVRSSSLVGEIESTWLLDVGAGYDLNDTVPGLRLDVMVQNVLDTRHRYFIGAPEMGRIALARLTYSFE